jgi:hypothetical protein
LQNNEIEKHLLWQTDWKKPKIISLRKGNGLILNFSYLAKDGKFIKDENIFKICKKTFAPVCSIRGNNDQFSFLS